jgi:hypothetical protein
MRIVTFLSELQSTRETTMTLQCWVYETSIVCNAGGDYRAASGTSQPLVSLLALLPAGEDGPTR